MLEQLYRRQYSAALLYCTALCGSEQLAQDIVADAFVKAWLSLPEDIPSFRGWLLRVCRNLWIDQLRRRRFLTGEAPPECLSDGETPESRYLHTERSRALWKAVAELPPADRELVILHYIAGLSLQEAAPILGKSHSAVRQQISRARRILKSTLEEQGYGSE